MNRTFLSILSVLLLGVLHVSAQSNTSNAAYKIKSGEITLQLSNSGDITGLFIGQSPLNWIVSGGTLLKGLHIKGSGAVKSSSKNGAFIFSRTMEDSIGNNCVVTDVFTPKEGSIRWEISITGNDTPWTTAILSQLKCFKPEGKLMWTTWSDPNHSDEKEWHDPFVFHPFTNQVWTYGNQKHFTPEHGDFISIPMVSIVEPSTDKAISIILSPEDHLLNLQLAVMKSGEVAFSRDKNRIGSGSPLHFAMDIVAHEADWRGGLRWMVNRYPLFFNPVNPAADEIGGCGAYSGYEDPVDVQPLKKMAFHVNWKLSDDFPWMGMFLPPLSNENDTWKRACDEPLPLGKDSIQSFRKMNDYSKWMRNNGFHVINYFNVTEFGRNMNNPPQRTPNDPELWKDPVAFAKYELPNAVLIPGAATFYGASVLDCGDTAYQNFLLQQAERHIRMLPYSSGICIDRMDWLRNDNVHADDGQTIVDGKPARSLFESWKTLLARLSPLMHEAKKVIFVNPMAMRLDLMKDIDGFYSEHGETGPGLNSMAFISMRKPAITWTYMWWGTWEQAPKFTLTPDADQFFQRHLLMGVFPTAPYPYNNHAIGPQPETDKQYMDYGALLEAMRGKKWVLAAHCVETSSPRVKLNMFEVPSGYVVPVTFGGTATTVVVQVRNIPNLEKMKATVILPGTDIEVPVPVTYKAGVLELKVPIKRGCGIVKLTKAAR